MNKSKHGTMFATSPLDGQAVAGRSSHPRPMKNDSNGCWRLVYSA